MYYGDGERPSDYLVKELIGGVLGMSIGAIAGAIGGGVLGFLAPDDCSLYCGKPVFFGMMAGGLLGVPIGTGLGVTVTGNAKGVEGNAVLAFIGSLAGTVMPFLGLVISHSSLYLLPVAPVALATLGYNIGAKMKDTGQPASLPWTLDLPVLSLAF